MKQNYLKRLTALLLALSMTLSLACTGFAAELSTDTAEVSATSAVDESVAEQTQELDLVSEDASVSEGEPSTEQETPVTDDVTDAEDVADEATEEELEAVVDNATNAEDAEAVEADEATETIQVAESTTIPNGINEDDGLFYYNNALFTGIVTVDDEETYYYQGELMNGYYREDEGSLLYLVTNGVKGTTPFSGQFKTGIVSNDVTYSVYLYGGDILVTDPTDSTDPADESDNANTDPADGSGSMSTDPADGSSTGDVSTPDDSTDPTPDEPVVDNNLYTPLNVGSATGLYYKDGEPYTGYMCQPNTGKVYSVTNGKASGVNTKMASNVVVYNNLFNQSWTLNTSFKGLYVLNSQKFTGFRRSTEGGNLYYMNQGVIVGGTTYTGVMDKSASYYVGWKVATDAKGNAIGSDGKYYEQGKLLTGVALTKLSNGKTADNCLYNKGVKYTKVKTGFVTLEDASNPVKKKYYYIKNGTAKGYINKEGRNVYLKNNGQTFRYTFKANGEIVTDLFSYKTAYKKSKMKLYFCRTYTTKKGINSSNMGTILLYDSAKKKYDIAAKSFVVGMSVNATDTKPGTYYLASPRRWFKFVSPETKLTSYMPYGFHIQGSGSLLHGSSYRSDNTKTLIPHIYNQLGENVSRQCVRAQVVNCKLIYSIATQYSNVTTRKSHMSVNITRSSSNYKPFGQMTLLNNFDYNGYLYRGKRTGFGSYNKKEGYSFDPTDPAHKGQTVYIAPNRSTYDISKCKTYKAC